MQATIILTVLPEIFLGHATVRSASPPPARGEPLHLGLHAQTQTADIAGAVMAVAAVCAPKIWPSWIIHSQHLLRFCALASL